MKKSRLCCPHCGRFNDAHTHLTDPAAVPCDDDVSFCFGCGQWAIFDDGGFRLPTTEERGTIADNPDCQRIEMAWKLMRRPN